MINSGDRSASSRRAVLAGAAGATLVGLTARPTMAAPSLPLRPISKDPPRAIRVLRVPEDHPNVKSALAASLPGDHVSLADGIYPGDRTWVLPGLRAPARFVVVRARNRHKAVFTGRITLASPGIWLHDLATDYHSLTDKIESQDYSIGIRASQTRITRCSIRSLGGVRIYSQLPEHRDIIIAYNDFISDRPYRYGDAQLYIGDVTGERSGPTEIDIAYNRFVDTAKDRRRLADGSIAPVNGRFAIYLGHSKPGANPSGVNLSIRIHHNAILGHRPHAIYTKRHVYIGFNYVENVDLTTVAPQIGFRHGGDPFGAGGIIEGNFAQGNGINVNDFGARILGNHVPSGAIRLHCGSGTWDAERGRYDNLYQAASGSILIGNRATYRVGYSRTGVLTRYLLESEGGKVRDVRIHMAGLGNASDVLFEAFLPVSPEFPDLIAGPYARKTILIDPRTSGGRTFPEPVGAWLLAEVGAHVA